MTVAGVFLGQFDVTVKKSVTITAPVAPFTPGAPALSKRRYMLLADATVFIQRNTDADTTTSAPLVANTPYTIELRGDDTLSYVTASTANLYITLLG